MFALFLIFHRFYAGGGPFRFRQVANLSAAWMAHSHGSNRTRKKQWALSPRPFYRDEGGELRSFAGLADFFTNARFRCNSRVGNDSCAITMAAGHSCGRLANYPHTSGINW